MADVKLQIDKEFRGLMRELTEEEFNGLEAEILADGRVRDPILYWLDGTKAMVIDGMHRLEIATKHSLKYPTAPKHFKTRHEVKTWILQHQRNRRNLNEAQLAMSAAKLTEMNGGPPAEKTEGGEDKPKQPTKTVKEAASVAGVSTRTVEMARKVINEGVPSLVKAVESGEVSMSAAVAVAELPEARQREIVKAGPEKVREVASKARVKAAAKRERAAKAEKQNGAVRKSWSDKLAVDQFGRTAKQIDAMYCELQDLFDECKSLVGGEDRDIERVARAVKQATAKSQDALDGVVQAFRTWRPK